MIHNTCVSSRQSVAEEGSRAGILHKTLRDASHSFSMTQTKNYGIYLPLTPKKFLPLTPFDYIES